MSLLYDHICYELSQKKDKLSQERLCLFQSMPVYEITNVLKTCANPDGGNTWTEELSRPIEKRPPHERLWVEWEHKDPGDGESKIGCVVANIDKSTLLGAETEVDDEIAHQTTMKEFLEKCEETYLVSPFMKLTKWSDEVPSGREKELLGQLIQSKEGVIIGLYDESRQLYRYRLTSEAKDFGLPVRVPVTTIHKIVCNPPWMAFSLLNCRNVSTETVAGGKRKSRELRQGVPDRADYKVLRLELPREIKPRSLEVSSGEARHVRFHLCRGHFKQLKNERYTHKRGQFVWWPASWRGSRDNGTVKKRYELHGREDGHEK